MTQAFFQDSHIIHRRHRWINRLHTWLLVGGSLLLLAVTAWAIAGTTGIIYALVFGAISLTMARRMAPSMVLRMYKARPVDARSFPEGHAMVAELSRRAGLPKPPQLHVVPSNMLNAFAVGRIDESAVAVTDSLIRTLTARELAGVLAHEITHIRNEDIKVMSLADMVSRFTSTLSMIGVLAILFNVSGFFQISWLGILAMIAAPTIGSLIQLALSRTREFDADYGAAMLTGDPDGLSSALRKLERWQRRRLESMALPAGRMAEPSMLRSHPPTADRVARLDALKATLMRPPVTPSSPERPKLHGRPRRTRSSVPQVRGRFGAHFLSSDPDWMALAEESEPAATPCTGLDQDRPCRTTPLAEPESLNPRVRLERGGAWW